MPYERLPKPFQITSLNKDITMAKNKTIDPVDLISMEQKIKTAEDKEKKRIDVGVAEQGILIDKNIQTLIDSGTIKLPLREDDPKFDDWIPFNQPSEKEFYTETLQPIVTGYVTQMLKGVEFDKSYFGKDGILLPIEQQRLYNGIAKTIFGTKYSEANVRAIKLIIQNMFNLTTKQLTEIKMIAKD